MIHAEWGDAAVVVLTLVLALWLGQVMWRAAEGGIDLFTGENFEKSAVERRALAAALEQYDRELAKARPVAGAEPGNPDSPLLPGERVDGRVHEPADRGYEARIAARMKERGDPG